jgi:leucyl aminopeptidase
MSIFSTKDSYVFSKHPEITVAKPDMAKKAKVIIVYVNDETIAAAKSGKISIPTFEGQEKNLLAQINYAKFEAKCGEFCVLTSPSEPVQKIILAGLSSCKKEKADKKTKQKCHTDAALAYQNSGGSLSDVINATKTEEVAIMLDFIDFDSEEHKNDAVANIAFGIAQKTYRFNKYLTTEKAQKKLPKLQKIIISSNNSKELKPIVEKYIQQLENINLVRDLVNEPGNIIYPASYAAIVKEVFSGLNVSIKILKKKDLEKIGMHMLLGVGQGSDNESHVVIMEYYGNKDKKDIDLALVGKGITFDTGGLSIKPAKSMEDMKSDMAGSATVVGSLRLLAQRGAKANVIGIVGLVENSINGSAQRPGDIVKSLSGQTVEVLNTDAEGRLILGDMLYYVATQYKPSKIIDFATLTGAILVALGNHYAGLFSNDDELAEQLSKAGKSSGDKLWRLPIGCEYDKMIDSEIADMKNISNTGTAGSITAAQFLKRFIADCTSWAHIDIAGTAYDGKYGESVPVKGGSGYGVRLVNSFVSNNIETK